MSTYDASIKKAFLSQADLINTREHCSADPGKLVSIDCAVGCQVRVVRDSTQCALYTVKEIRQESPDNVVRIGQSGRRRLGAIDEFDAIVDSQVPHPAYDDAEAEANSEFVERLTDDGTNRVLVACAPHGGAIEVHTDEQAERVAMVLAAEGVSLWCCKGWHAGGAAFDRWHITSTDISPASFQLLNSIRERGFTYAVSFHGFDEQRILIGGAAPFSLKQAIQEALQASVADSGIPVDIATGGDYNGDRPSNFVNWLTAGGAGGIQIEQSLAARSQYGEPIADAVAGIYQRLINNNP